ncbi:MAG: YjbQ family protein [Oscillospiraceae bacterium]|nr:YjbQ family protein [Oscillospiraceae bacterium]
MIHELKFNTKKNDVLSLTEQIEAIVAESGVQEGICIVHVPHTTAGVTITSKWDETDFSDIKTEMRRIVPTRVDFAHQFDTPEDAAGHIKSILIGANMTLIVHEGKLLLGSSQGVFFLEFDGPRSRKCQIKVIAD